jgi:hypothetical protein
LANISGAAYAADPTNVLCATMHRLLTLNVRKTVQD